LDRADPEEDEEDEEEYEDEEEEPPVGTGKKQLGKGGSGMNQ
jgi:hypothetical protein